MAGDSRVAQPIIRSSALAGIAQENEDIAVSLSPKPDHAALKSFWWMDDLVGRWTASRSVDVTHPTICLTSSTSCDCGHLPYWGVRRR